MTLQKNDTQMTLINLLINKSYKTEKQEMTLKEMMRSKNGHLENESHKNDKTFTN